MQRIAVYFSRPEIDDYPFNKEYYRTAYKELAQEIEKNGGRLFVVRGQHTYMGGNRFDGYWEFNGEWFVRKEGELDADVLYVKSEFQAAPDAHLVNSEKLNTLCVDKWKTYALFTPFFKQTFLVQSNADVQHAIKQSTTEKMVAKPIDGEEGAGVFVIPANEAVEKVTQFPYLLQEFIDTSKGIPGITSSTHDLRIISINGEPVLSFVRTPPQGSYLANVAQGGTKIDVDLEDIPEGALAIQRSVDAKMSRFGRRIYSVDIGLDADGTWKIIELNAQPGCTCKAEGQGSSRFQKRLAEFLISAAVSRRH